MSINRLAMSSDSPKPTTSQPLLTPEKLEEWIAEYVDTEGEYKALGQRLERMAKRLTAVLELFDEDSVIPENLSRVLNLPTQVARVETWSDAIIDVLTSSERGLEPHEIAKALKQTEFKDRIISNPNGLYNALTKLYEKGIAAKVGKLIYIAEHVDNSASKSVSPDPLVISGYGIQPGTTAEFIVKVLDANPNGLRGAEIVEELRRIDGAPKSVFEHSSFIYTALGKLVGKNVIRREGKVFKPLLKAS